MAEGDQKLGRSCADGSFLQEGWRGALYKAGRKRGNGLKAEQGQVRLGIRRKFLVMSVVRHWDGLSREAVDSSSLQVLKARLGEASLI